MPRIYGTIFFPKAFFARFVFLVSPFRNILIQVSLHSITIDVIYLVYKKMDEVEETTHYYPIFCWMIVAVVFIFICILIYYAIRYHFYSGHGNMSPCGDRDDVLDRLSIISAPQIPGS